MYHKLKIKPHILFLVDAFGALLSALVLATLLMPVVTSTGSIKNFVCLLILLPIVFLLFDLYALSTKSKKLKLKLKTIAFLNLSYCLFSSTFLFIHHPILPLSIIFYLIAEILVISALAAYEFYIASKS